MACTVSCATSMLEISAAGPSGPPRPSAIARPEAISLYEAAWAYGAPGLKPRLSMNPAAPSGPGPSYQPKAFWAPCEAMPRPERETRGEQAEIVDHQPALLDRGGIVGGVLDDGVMRCAPWITSVTFSPPSRTGSETTA